MLLSHSISSSLCPVSMSPLSTFCFIASIETGISLITLYLFINACLAFAGEAALYFGFLSAMSLQITGTSIPPGTPLSQGLHQLLIGLGFYALLGSIFGLFALLKRNLRFAQALYVVLIVNFCLSLVMVCISLFSNAPITILFIQLPPLFLNLYFALITRSFVISIKSNRGTILEDRASHNSTNGEISSNISGKEPDKNEHQDGQIDTGVSEEDVGILKLKSETRSSSTRINSSNRRDGNKHSVTFSSSNIPKINTSQHHKITIGSDLDDEDEEIAGDLSLGSGATRSVHPALIKISKVSLSS
jgi:hypothetical protein